MADDEALAAVVVVANSARLTNAGAVSGLYWTERYWAATCSGVSTSFGMTMAEMTVALELDEMVELATDVVTLDDSAVTQYSPEVASLVQTTSLSG